MTTKTYGARKPVRRVAAAAAAVSLALLLGACRQGGSGADDPSGSREPDTAEVEDAMLEYAECMREQGVPMEDPEPGGRGGVLVDGREMDPETLQTAEEECGHLLEDVLPEEGMGDVPAEQKEAMLAQAQCMRDRGWDMPDPQFDGSGRVQMQLGGDIDPGDPSFRADQEECAEESGVEAPQMEGP